MSKFNNINNNDYEGLSPYETLIEKYLDNSITQQEFNSLVQEAKTNRELYESLQNAYRIKQTLKVADSKTTKESVATTLDRLAQEDDERMEDIKNRLDDLVPKFQNQTLSKQEVNWLLEEYEYDKSVFEFFGVNKDLVAFLERGGKASWLQENIINPINNLIAIFQQYYETLPYIEIAYRSRRGLLEAAEKHGRIVLTMRELYKSKNFQKFIMVYNQTANEKVKADLQLQYAIALFEVGRVKEAEQKFIFMIKKDHYDTEKINWLLAMLYLQQGKVDSAKKYLQEVIDCPIPYRVDEAKEILSNL